MAYKLDITPISDSAQMPIKKGTLQFLQLAHSNTANEILTAMVGPSFDALKMYVLWGCKNTGSYPAYNISSGAVWYLGEVYHFDGASFSVTGSNVAVVKLSVTQYTSDADPVTFTDASTHNVHNIRKVTIESAVSGSGLQDYVDVIFDAVRYPQATETVSGVAQIATQAETNAGLDNTTIVTPARLSFRTATFSRTGIAELATQAEVDGGTDQDRIVTPDTLAQTYTVLHVDGTDKLRRLIIDIGDWDMDSTTNLNVAHTIADFTKIRSIEAFVRNDADTAYYPLAKIDAGGTGNIQGGVSVWDSTNVTLSRLASGNFDSADFNSTGYNRGFIVIEYIA